MTGTIRFQRRQAKDAIAAARRAEAEAHSLARLLPAHSPTRERMSRALVDATTARLAAEHVRKDAPVRAARTALRATARLERAATGVVPHGDPGAGAHRRRRAPAPVRTPGTPLVAVDAREAKIRAKTRARAVKAHRKELARVRGWAKAMAASVAVHTIAMPTDADSAKERRAARRDAFRGLSQQARMSRPGR